MSVNTFCHIEFQSTDMARTQAFLGGMFGWYFRAFDDDMVVFGLGDEHLGGLTKVDKVEAGMSPTVWIQVLDVDASLAKAESLGGKIVTGKQPVPNVGWSGLVADQDGNHIGLVQFKEPGS
jgi:uncharacterized protein